MNSEKKFRYNDKSERYHVMNRLFHIAALAVLCDYLAYLWLNSTAGKMAWATCIGNTAAIIFFVLLNTVLFFQNRAGTKLKTAISIEFGFLFLTMALQTDAEFINIVLLGVLAVQIPYYDAKNYIRTGIAYMLLYVLEIVVRSAKHTIVLDTEYVCTTYVMLGVFYVLLRAGKISKSFSDHALGAVTDQNGRQQEMMSGMLSISETVKQESDKSTGMMEELVESTKVVAHSMQEISTATGVTAENISEQSIMTQNIQESIGETLEKSGQMVNIARESNVSIQDNMHVMEELKEQSTQIAATNEQVTDAMGRLQDKTREAEEIADMILSISSQTNLLALNASIESARAGEAGRGFAVVADQIRQLAEQTKSSTENITRIIEELNQNANQVVHSVEKSVDAAANQNKMIHTAADSFEKLDQNMEELIVDIQEIDQRINHLSDANNRIVESISQLSATTEEVTASAEQANVLSEKNLRYVEQTKDAIILIQTTTQELEQYL